ncbi:protein Turandot X [Drosophila takahashii]|uniref:protein Turandot X n=1 Tax=Drosophila takahashii TaxID=29030 RepID=UPI001CF89297|nr:protein Turandot X [Drosophila takahashii]
MGFYFSSLLTALLSIVCSASAEINDPLYESQRQFILQVFHNPNVNTLTKEKYIPDLISFYLRYPNDVPLSDVERQQFDRFIQSYNYYRNVLIDGVHPQGGAIGSIFGNFLGRLGSRYVTALFNKKKEGQENRDTNSTTLPRSIQNFS